MKATNTHSKPEFEGQIVKHRVQKDSKAVRYDIAKRNEQYGWLEWHSLGNATEKQKRDAVWAG